MSRRLAGLVFCLAFVPLGARAQVVAGKLLFTAITPCRLADTGLAGGAVPANTSRDFTVFGPTTDYSTQGGSAAGCGIPDFGQVQAVFFNFVARNPAGPGNLRAYPGGGSLPTASTLNFQKLTPNLNSVNGIAIPVRTTTVPADVDLTVYSAISATEVVIDVVGYFSKAEPRKYFLTTGSVPGNAARGACATAASGYHMASLREIFDTSHLEYETTVGLTTDDSGKGPPSGRFGWVRTGVDNNNSVSAGAANCQIWSSPNNTSSGTVAQLNPSWAQASVAISPWVPGVFTCDQPFPVWCVQDLP